MCRINVSGHTNIMLTCESSGKPINITRREGMFCEDLCELDECKNGITETENLIKALGKMFGDE
jgi:hypothetical protein